MTPPGAEKTREIVVIGCGTIGLPLAVAFASRGASVLGVDIEAERISGLSGLRLAVGEPELQIGLENAVRTGALHFATSCSPASKRRAFILVVPTPIDAAGDPAMGALEAAAETAFQCAKAGDLIIVRATVPVGKTRALAEKFAGCDSSVLLAYCPDRSMAGTCYRDQFSVPNVAGGLDAASVDAAAMLFDGLGRVVKVSSLEAAEAIKLFCNAQRDMTFAIANHFALISEALGLDIAEIGRSAADGYQRFQMTRPGPVGGPCLPKDSFLLHHSLGDGFTSPALAITARRVNLSLVDHVVKAVLRHIRQRELDRPILAILGLAFKGRPEIDDRRGSFGIAVADSLAAQLPAATIRRWDAVDASPMEETLLGTDVVVLANDHRAISELDLASAASQMQRHGLIYDVCGAFQRRRDSLPNGVALHIFGDGLRI